MVQIAAKERGRRRRREILRAASEVFREKGSHGAGMRDIASALGIAVGKLYYWFESKQDLLAFCQEDTLRRLLRMMDRVAALDLDPDRSLVLVVRGHVRCLNVATPGSLAHLEVESLEEPRRAPILALRNRYERLLQEIVRDGVRMEIFADVDPRLVVRSLLGAVNWTVKWYRPGGRVPLGEIEDAVARHQVRGLLAEGRTLEVPREDLLAVLADSEEDHD